MPVYNGRQYFEQALISAISAVGQSDEIVVVEDGSTDGGVEQIVSRHSDSVTIRYFLKTNGGVGSALNIGIEKAKNPVFTWLSHDDLYLPNRLTVDRHLRRAAPDIVTVSDFYLNFEITGKCVHVCSTRKIGSRQNVKLLGSRFVNGNCLSAPVQLLKSLGGFNESLKHTQDYDLWCRLLKTTAFAAIPTATVISRQHPNQDSKKAPIAARQEYKRLIRKHLSFGETIDPRNLLELFKIIKNTLGY